MCRWFFFLIVILKATTPSFSSSEKDSDLFSEMRRSLSRVEERWKETDVVRVYLWKPMPGVFTALTFGGASSPVGHASLSLGTDYVSYYPHKKTGGLPSTHEEDTSSSRPYVGVSPHCVFRINCPLKQDEMRDRIRHWRRDNGMSYVLDRINCAYVVADVLQAGGFPISGRETETFFFVPFIGRTPDPVEIVSILEKEYGVIIERNEQLTPARVIGGGMGAIAGTMIGAILFPGIGMGLGAVLGASAGQLRCSIL